MNRERGEREFGDHIPLNNVLYKAMWLPYPRSPRPLSFTAFLSRIKILR
jgi:hypothetical protein